MRFRSVGTASCFRSVCTVWMKIRLERLSSFLSIVTFGDDSGFM